MAKARTTDLQIRGIPVPLRDRLRQRADRKGLSMSQYVIEKLKADLALPSTDEWLAEAAKLSAVDLAAHDLSGAQLVHEARAEDDAEDAGLWP